MAQTGLSSSVHTGSMDSLHSPSLRSASFSQWTRFKVGAPPMEGKAALATSSWLVISKERSSHPPGIHVSNLRETVAPGPFTRGRHWIWLLLCLKLLPGFPTSTNSTGWKTVQSVTRWPCLHLCTSCSFLQSPHPQPAYLGNFCIHNSRPTSAPPALRKHCWVLQRAFWSASSPPAATHTFPRTPPRHQHPRGNVAIYLSVSPSKLQIPCLCLINLWRHSPAKHTQTHISTHTDSKKYVKPNF